MESLWLEKTFRAIRANHQSATAQGFEIPPGMGIPPFHEGIFP